MISPGVPEGKPEPRRPLGEKGAEAPPSGPDPACVRTPSLIILAAAAYLPPPSPTLRPYRSPSPLLFGVFLSGTVSVNTVLIMISTGNRSPERVSPTRANKNLPAIPCHRLPCPPPTRSGNVTLRGPRPRGLPAAQAGTRSSGWGQGRGWLGAGAGLAGSSTALAWEQPEGGPALRMQQTPPWPPQPGSQNYTEQCGYWEMPTQGLHPQSSRMALSSPQLCPWHLGQLRLEQAEPFRGGAALEAVRADGSPRAVEGR